MRGPCKFRQSEIVRAVRAARAAGVEVHSIEIDAVGGKIVVNTGSGGDPKVNSADRILEKIKNERKS
jgi:hypothetical protein